MGSSRSLCRSLLPRLHRGPWRTGQPTLSCSDPNSEPFATAGNLGNMREAATQLRRAFTFRLKFGSEPGSPYTSAERGWRVSSHIN